MSPTKNSLEAIQKVLNKKFGEHVCALKRRKGEVYLEYKGVKKWVRTRTIFDRTLAETLFLTGSQIKKVSYKQVRKTKAEQRLKRAEGKLQQLGLAEVEAVSATGKWFTFSYRQVTFKMSVYSFSFEVKTKLDFLRRYYAWTRFKSLDPIRVTDKEWKSKIERASNGGITSSRYVPAKFGKPVLKCLRCNLEFSKPKLFNKKNSIIRCPNCDAKQSKNYSRQALAWIKDLESRFKIKIRHAESKQGEAKIQLQTGKQIYVDGLYKDVVFEYHGSRWHGDITLFYLDDTPNPYDTKRTTLHLLKQTVKREIEIKKAGFKLIRIWGPDFVSEERYSQWLLMNSRRLKAFLMQP